MDIFANSYWKKALFVSLMLNYDMHVTKKIFLIKNLFVKQLWINFRKNSKTLLENIRRRAYSNEERKKKISRLKNIVSEHLK